MPWLSLQLAATALLLVAASRVALAGGATELVSVGRGGTEANAGNSSPDLSMKGRFVAFGSEASNLVPGDTNGVPDIFVRNLALDRTERVSVGSDESQATGDSFNPSISADGRFVAFSSLGYNLFPDRTSNNSDILVRDRVTGRTELISVPWRGRRSDEGSSNPSISAGGRFVAFSSNATNLVRGDTNGFEDIFVRDRKAGTTERVSIGSRGQQANAPEAFSFPSISAGGRFVAFDSVATNLAPGATNGRIHVLVRDRQKGTARTVSVRPDGAQENRDSVLPQISGDGRYIAFVSDSSNLVPGDTNGLVDAFVNDRVTGRTTRVSVSSDGAQGNSDVDLFTAISADGRLVTFTSRAINLVPNDTNEAGDVFLHDRETGETRRVNLAPDGA